MEERRKSTRIKKSLTILYSRGIHNLDKQKWDMTVIRDISATGICITANENFAADEILTFRIKIPLQPFEWIEFRGRVVASEELKNVLDKSLAQTYITRIEFMDLKEESKKLIQEYIGWVLSKKEGI